MYAIPKHKTIYVVAFLFYLFLRCRFYRITLFIPLNHHILTSVESNLIPAYLKKKKAPRHPLFFNNWTLQLLVTELNFFNNWKIRATHATSKSDWNLCEISRNVRIRTSSRWSKIPGLSSITKYDLFAVYPRAYLDSEIQSHYINTHSDHFCFTSRCRTCNRIEKS